MEVAVDEIVIFAALSTPVTIPTDLGIEFTILGLRFPKLCGEFIYMALVPSELGTIAVILFHNLGFLILESFHNFFPKFHFGYLMQ